ncbi:DUF5906 domain-containing protein [uncultured Roseovarius sp.]|uniref:DUF5906 domain-containing protein n=1 Tax=uncultured Roseovarius sp. TaxID=293344 RepID=UPI002599D57B|nr:DUF5906 domain-containing protein [uncultured Roseovarius sp.]
MADLATLPIWAARGKAVDRKRAPINPKTGVFAKVDKPTTWAKRSRAEKRAAGFKHDPGVGLMLGAAGAPEGYVLAGLDLDGCRDPETGEIEGWAESVVWRFGSYAEASPSGGGLHVLFYARLGDLDALRESGLVENQGRSFQRGGHTEIGAFFGGKFLTVTDAAHTDMLHECDTIRAVNLDTLEWLLGDYGPAWAKAAPGSTSNKGDKSGSGHAYRLALDVLRDGADVDAAREALAEDDGEAGDWWGRTTDRERRRVIENAAQKVADEAAALADVLDDLPEDEAPDDGGKKSVLDRMNDRHAFTYMGTSGVVADFTGGQINFRTVAAFREMYGNRKAGKQKLGAWWLEHTKRRTYDRGVVFDPSGRAPKGVLNLWRGFAVKPDVDSDCGLILDYVRDVVAGGDPAHADYVLSWLADVVQNPARKPGVALVLKGLKGVGKDTLAEIMRRIIGTRHVAHVTSTDRLTGRFNGPFATALIGHVEEASWGGNRDAKGVLQSLITSPVMPLERKGVDTIEVDSFLRLIFTTNEEWAIPATADERRYAVFEVPAHRKGDVAYWDALYAQIEGGGLAGFMAHLMDWQTPDGVSLRRPPNTAALAGQKLAGLRNVDAWWLELLTDGELPGLDDLDQESGWLESSQIVEKPELREAYEAWMQGKRWHGETLGAAQFSRALAHICPGIGTMRIRDDGANRTRCYTIPPLGECRDQFNEAMNLPRGEGGWYD